MNLVKASSLAWWLVILGAADLVLTRLILLQGDGTEANPLIRPHLWTWQLFAVKVGVPLLIVFLVYVLGDQVRLWTVIMVAALYGWIVAANVLNLKEALGW